jgi:hypothetical protein
MGEMTRYLLRHGIPFQTVKCFKRDPGSRVKRRSIGLGLREYGHKFDAAEYLAYENSKNDLLSSSLGPVAMKEGGILWWLAKDIIKPRAVIKGPSKTCSKGGCLVGHLGGAALVDDWMGFADEDIICGVYHVSTGALA